MKRIGQRRRQRLVLLTCAWIFIVPGLGWIAAHALLGHRQAAWHTTGAVLIGLALLWAVRRGYVRLALTLFCGGAWAMVVLLALTLDIPSADVGRGIHHYLLPIYIAQRFVLQGRAGWVHQGVPAISLLLFVGLHGAGNPLQLVSPMSDAQRLVGLQVTATLSLLLCALLFRLQQVELRERGSLPLQLARALRRPQQQQLQLHLQPQVDAQGRPVGAEALLRWPLRRGGEMPPLRLLDVAEQHGLLPGLSEWVLQQALQILQAWAADPALARLRLAVNLSAAELRDAGMREQLLARLSAHAALCPQLALELPEALLAEPDEALRDFARRVRALGVQLTLDRFGHGRSALAQLDGLPLTQLKTDPALLQGLEQPDGPARTVLLAVLDLGRSLGLEVLVHGVETVAQEQALRELGCQRLQGRHLGAVMNMDAFARWVRARERR